MIAFLEVIAYPWACKGQGRTYANSPPAAPRFACDLLEAKPQPMANPLRREARRTGRRLRPPKPSRTNPAVGSPPGRARYCHSWCPAMKHGLLPVSPFRPHPAGRPHGADTWYAENPPTSLPESVPPALSPTCRSLCPSLVTSSRWLWRTCASRPPPPVVGPHGADRQRRPPEGRTKASLQARASATQGIPSPRLSFPPQPPGCEAWARGERTPPPAACGRTRGARSVPAGG